MKGLNHFFYGIFIQGLNTTMHLASLFNKKAKKWVEGRTVQNLFFPGRDFSKPLVWMHASSLGEYEQGLPVINQLKKLHPEYQFAVSFFSPSGYEVIKKKNTSDFIFYFPLDTKKNAQTLIKNLQPSYLLLVKYDYWYETLRELQKNKIKVYVISSKFKENFIAFKPYGKWFYSILKSIDHFFVQDEKSKKVLINKGIEQVSISGDTRYDRVKELLEVPKTLTFLEEFKGEYPLLVAGSTWKKDDELLLNAFSEIRKENQKLKLVLVPHEINPTYMQELKQKFPKTLLYSELKEKNLTDYDTLLIDTVGLLTKIYAYADVAYVGGAFDKDGVHNVLEPAVFGVPVLFGPNIKKYEEAQRLIQEQGGEIVSNPYELNSTLSHLLANEKQRLSMGKNAQTMILNQEKATDIISNYIENKR